MNEIDEIRNHIDALPGPVELIIVRDAALSDAEEALEKRMRELTMFSHHLHLQIWIRASDPHKIAQFGVDRVPALLIHGVAGGRIRFYGTPTNSELIALLKTIKEAARGHIDLTPADRHVFSNLVYPLHLRLLVPPTSLFSPAIVAMAVKLAFTYNQVRADIVNVKDFPDLAARYAAHIEARVLVNGVSIPFVADTETAFVDSILKAVKS